LIGKLSDVRTGEEAAMEDRTASVEVVGLERVQELGLSFDVDVAKFGERREVEGVGLGGDDVVASYEGESRGEGYAAMATGGFCGANFAFIYPTLDG
jgi:hypothetical protein